MNESRMIGSRARGHSTKPLFRWQGGKQRLRPRLVSIFPTDYKRYFEPFIGAGSVYLAVRDSGFDGPAFLGDSNPDVVNVHWVVASDPTGFEQEYAAHTKCYSREHFYWLRSQDTAEWSSVAKAARTVYLAKAAFHGLYRVNSQGKVVSTYGTGELDRVRLDSGRIRDVSAAFCNADIRHADFGWVEEEAQPGDLVFLDPPYFGGNTAYVAGGFSLQDHLRLRRVCRALDAKGAFVVQTNADRPLVRDLYEGFRLFSVPPAPAIGRGDAHRQPVGELVIANFEPKAVATGMSEVAA